MNDVDLGRIFILGAGFSAPAGLPLTPELLPLVLDEVKDEVKDEDGWSHLHRSLDEYREFVEATTGDMPDPVDIEDFATYIDHQHHLGLLGSDTWSEEGNRDQFLLRWGIGRVLTMRTPALAELPELYLRFAEGLRPRDVVVTFNYDLILERALDAVSRKYRLFPNRYAEIGVAMSTIDSEAEAEEVLVLKVHGSLDWVSRASYESKLDYMRALQGEAGADFSYRHDVLFGPTPTSRTHPLVVGLIAPDDDLAMIDVIDDVESYYSHRIVAYHHPPLILAPSQAKQLYGQAIREFWKGMGLQSWAWGGFSMIGCSLPPADPYTKQILYALSRGYRQGLTDPAWRLGPMKRMCVVNRATGNDEVAGVHAAYRFLDSDHTDFFLDGLDLSVVERLFE